MGNIIVLSGFLAGAGIGLLMLAFLWVTGKPLGVSRNYGNILAHFSRLSFFQQQEYQGNGWRIWFIAGIVLGGFVAAMLAHFGTWQFNFEMGQAYDALLPHDLWLKIVVLFIGGLVMGVGSRLAGGCTSGHVIAGIPMLNLSSVLAAVLFFIGGFVTVQVMAHLGSI